MGAPPAPLPCSCSCFPAAPGSTAGNGLRGIPKILGMLSSLVGPQLLVMLKSLWGSGIPKSSVMLWGPQLLCISKSPAILSSL